MTIDYRLRNALIAFALAAAAVLLTVIYVTSANDDTAAGKQQVTVWVAERDFSVGTTGNEIAGSLRKEIVPRDAAAPQFVKNPKDVKGLLSTQPIYAGEQVTELRFATPKEQGIRTELRGTLRAISVSGDKDQLLAGTLQAGDRVDVVAVFKRNGLESDLRVICRAAQHSRAVDDRERRRFDGLLRGCFLGDVRGDRRAGQRLFLTTQIGEWTLQLRPVKKPRDSNRTIDTVEHRAGRRRKVTTRLTSGDDAERAPRRRHRPRPGRRGLAASSRRVADGFRSPRGPTDSHSRRSSRSRLPIWPPCCTARAWSRASDTEVYFSVLEAEIGAIRRHTRPRSILLVPDAASPALVDAALARRRRRRPRPAANGGDDRVRVDKAARPAPTPQLSVAAGAPRGEIITVFSPKGGTGKTVLSTNLAAYLASSRASACCCRPRPPVRRRRDHARASSPSAR